MSTNNPSTIELAAALSQVAKEIEAMRYQAVDARVHEWQEIHSAPFSVTVAGTEKATASQTKTVWKNTRKSPVILSFIDLQLEYAGSRVNVLKIQDCFMTVTAGDRTPMNKFHCPSTIAASTTTFWNNQQFGASIPMRLRIKPDDEIIATLNYDVNTVTASTSIFAALAILVSDF